MRVQSSSSSSRLADLGCMHAHLVRPRPLDLGADVGEQREHRVDVADARHVRSATGSLVSRQAARIGSAPFLFPAARHAPVQGLPAFDDEGLASARAATASSRSLATGYPTPRLEITRERAWETLTRYTKSEALLRHALAVEASIGAYAGKFGEDEELWARHGAAARLRLGDAPDARPAPAGRRADPARGGLPRGGDRGRPLPRGAPRAAARHAAEEDALRLRRAVRGSSTPAGSSGPTGSRRSSRSRSRRS